MYSLQIPDELRKPEEEYDFLIEVTLAYSAKVRRTRQKAKSYLSTWVDWISSKLGESFEEFSNRSLVDYSIENEDDTEENNDEEQKPVIQWKIRERNDWGDVKGLNRNNSSLQKDWAVLKSYELTKEINFVVRGHKGWDKNQEEVPYSLAISFEILGKNIPIYEKIKIENQAEIEV